MNKRKSKQIYDLAVELYKPEWIKRGLTFKNYYRQLKDEYTRGSYRKVN